MVLFLYIYIYIILFSLPEKEMWILFTCISILAVQSTTNAIIPFDIQILTLCCMNSFLPSVLYMAHTQRL